jgi:hypothetical protein
LFDYAPAGGRLDYAFNRRFDFKRERGTQTWTASFIKRREIKVSGISEY